MKQKVCGFLYSLVLSKENICLDWRRQISIMFLLPTKINSLPFTFSSLLRTSFLIQKTTLEVHIFILAPRLDVFMTKPLTSPNVILKVLEYQQAVHLEHTTIRKDLNETTRSPAIFYCCLYLYWKLYFTSPMYLSCIQSYFEQHDLSFLVH